MKNLCVHVTRSKFFHGFLTYIETNFYLKIPVGDFHRTKLCGGGPKKKEPSKKKQKEERKKRERNRERISRCMTTQPVPGACSMKRARLPVSEERKAKTAKQGWTSQQGWTKEQPQPDHPGAPVTLPDVRTKHFQWDAKNNKKEMEEVLVYYPRGNIYPRSHFYQISEEGVVIPAHALLAAVLFVQVARVKEICAKVRGMNERLDKYFSLTRIAKHLFDGQLQYDICANSESVQEIVAALLAGGMHTIVTLDMCQKAWDKYPPLHDALVVAEDKLPCLKEFQKDGPCYVCVSLLPVHTLIPQQKLCSCKRVMHLGCLRTMLQKPGRTINQIPACSVCSTQLYVDRTSKGRFEEDNELVIVNNMFFPRAGIYPGSTTIQQDKAELLFLSLVHKEFFVFEETAGEIKKMLENESFLIKAEALAAITRLASRIRNSVECFWDFENKCFLVSASLGVEDEFVDDDVAEACEPFLKFFFQFLVLATDLEPKQLCPFGQGRFDRAE